MRFIYIFLLLILTFLKVSSQDTIGNRFRLDSQKRVVIIQPTGETVNSLPEMTVLSDTTTLYKNVLRNINNSVISEFLDLYFIAQTYLKNNHESISIEPAYLALTENQGGFAKFGFSIKQKEGHIAKPQTPYVDIIVGQTTSTQDKLMSFTQLYPHELGHVIYHLLSPEDTISNNTKNVDMHFFSVVTDYSTAFNEGFAEHFENVARVYEKNESIKSGIFADIEKIGRSSKHSIRGFKRDFTYPFRLGFYKATMLGWYQKFEDYKRYEQAFSGDIRYKSRVLSLSNTEDHLTFRNSGVMLNKNELRNLVQLLSTEGVICSFFTHLTKSDLSKHYLDPGFYQPFLFDSNMTIEYPQHFFTPLQNQFIKYFKVLHKYLVFNNSSKSQLTDFIEGYIKEFPSEEDEIKRIFKRTVGIEYTNELPPPLWLLVKDYPHRLLTFDPFDAITVPIYTFDLNAAETGDLQTIRGIAISEAKKIIHYRKTNGYFTDLDELKLIPDLNVESVNKIISAAFDNEYFEETLKDFNPKLSIGTLIANPLKYIFSRACIYYLLLFVSVYFFLIKQKTPTVKHTIILFIKYLFLWLLFVLVGLVAVFLFEYAYLYIIGVSIFLAFLALLIYRKRRTEKLRTIVFIILMNLLILVSLV